MTRLLPITLLAASALAQASPVVERDGLLTTREGRTLYVSDRDAPGRSSCRADCLATWPAFAVSNPRLAGGDFGIVVRDDGSLQWAWRGQPLYLHIDDRRPGDRTGERIAGPWRVLRDPRFTPAPMVAPIDVKGCHGA